MDQARLQKLQALLEQEKQELLEVVQRLTGPGGLESPRDEADRELSAYDNHPADYGAEMYERSKDMGLLETTRQQILEIEEAQKAIAAGTYGICQSCGRQIPEARLLALPSTVLCVRCKRTREQDTKDRPVEDEIMRKPVEPSLARRTEYAFDREEAWEEVAQFGTSSDPVEQS